MKNQKTNWWLDALLFTGFIATFLMDLTGVELHQWIGITIGALIFIHLAFHWNWVVTVVDRFFGNTAWRARINLLIDGTLVGGFFMIILTGLVISTWLSLSIVSNEVWKNVHILSSVITLFLLLVKIVMHRKWIINIAEKFIFSGVSKEANPLPVQFQPTKSQVSRREFLKISGVVGAASLIGVSQIVKLARTAAESEAKTLSSQTVPITEVQQIASIDPVPATVTQNATAVELTSVQPILTQPTSVPTQVPVQSQVTSACSVRCNRRCSFPGNCRRYTDSNGNNKCDLGECV
jgi:hypothetical protein